MKYRSLPISMFRIAAVCAALFAGSVSMATPEPQLFVHLSFDDNSLALNGTGTFTISGKVRNVGGSASNAWQAYGPPSTPGILWLQVVAQDLTPIVTYNDTPVSVGMTGSSFLTFWGGVSFAIQGPDSGQPSGAFLQIGNGTTDFISGTFKISILEDIGSLAIADLNMSFSNVNVIASAVPEPATYGVLAGMGALGLAGLRRRRRAAQSRSSK